MPARFTIRQLSGSDAWIYRDLRLEALKQEPRAFTAAYEDEASCGLDAYARRVTDNVVLGGFLTDGRLAGMAGLVVPDGAKLRHRGTLWGVYVRPEARGLGMAKALVAGVVARARTVVEVITLGVGAYNAPALKVYESQGFIEYARDSGLIKIGDDYVDEILMTRRLNPPT